MPASTEHSQILDSLLQAPGHRRSFLQAGLTALGGMAAAGYAASPAQAATQPKVATQARIVIAGAGAAGLTAAARLSAALDGARITLIDARRDYYYQPGFTLVGAGIKPATYVVSSPADYVPAGVELVPERVVEFDVEGNQVVTESGARHAYDFLIVATGLQLESPLSEGMDPRLIV